MISPQITSLLLFARIILSAVISAFELWDVESVAVEVAPGSQESEEDAKHIVDEVLVFSFSVGVLQRLVDIVSVQVVDEFLVEFFKGNYFGVSGAVGDFQVLGVVGSFSLNILFLH